MCYLIDLYTFMFTTVVAIRKKNTSECGKSLKLCLVVVYVT